MDSHVGKHILDEVLSSKTGLLHNKTRILVTNSLFVLPDVDYIVVLKNGRITDYGTYEELMAQEGNFAELINLHTTNNVPDNESVTSEESVVTRHRASTVVSNHDDQDNSKLVEVERAETGNVKFTIYKKFAQSMSLFWSLSIIFGYALTNAANSGSSFWLSDWTADTSGNNRYGYRLGVYAAIGVVQAVTVCYAWIGIVSGTLLASRTLHRKLLLKIMHAPMHFFDTTPLGRIMNRFSKDIDILDTTMQLTLRYSMISHEMMNRKLTRSFTEYWAAHSSKRWPFWLRSQFKRQYLSLYSYLLWEFTMVSRYLNNYSILFNLSKYDLFIF